MRVVTVRTDLFQAHIASISAPFHGIVYLSNITLISNQLIWIPCQSSFARLPFNHQSARSNPNYTPIKCLDFKRFHTPTLQIMCTICGQVESFPHGQATFRAHGTLRSQSSLTGPNPDKTGHWRRLARGQFWEVLPGVMRSTKYNQIPIQ